MRAMVLCVGLAGGLNGNDGATVAIQTFKYGPKTLEVAVGTSVTWTNGDEIEHTVSAGIPEHPDSLFDHALPTKGSTYEFTFARPGTFTYFCARHPFMRGEIRVVPKGDK